MATAATVISPINDKPGLFVDCVINLMLGQITDNIRIYDTFVLYDRETYDYCYALIKQSEQWPTVYA